MIFLGKAMPSIYFAETCRFSIPTGEPSIFYSKESFQGPFAGISYQMQHTPKEHLEKFADYF